jgi:hypothetical protein
MAAGALSKAKAASGSIGRDGDGELRCAGSNGLTCMKVTARTVTAGRRGRTEGHS